MSAQMLSMIPEWLKSLFPYAASIVAAFFSARWAAMKVFQERWWERKEKAYTEIIEALHDLTRYSSICAQENLSGEDHPKKKEFGDRYSEAYWKIQRVTDIGAFVICEQAASILSELRNKPKLNWNDNPSWEIYEQNSNHYQNALERIRKCAIQDLKKNRWL